MKVKFDHFSRAEEPNLFVCNPDNTQLAPIARFYDSEGKSTLKPELSWNGVSTLNVNIYKYAGKTDDTYYSTENNSKAGVQIQINNYQSQITSLNQFGKTSQAQTVQGKNIFDKNRITRNAWINKVNGNISAYDSSAACSDYIPVIAGQFYTKNDTYDSWALYDTNKVFVSGGSAVTTFTPTVNGFVRISMANNDSEINTKQLEKGMVSTSYAPFVPNSPSIDYPSPITRVSKTIINGVEYPIPDGCGYDGDSYNHATGQGIVTKKLIEFSGTENFYSTGTDGIIYFVLPSASVSNYKCFCSHFEGNVSFSKGGLYSNNASLFLGVGGGQFASVITGTTNAERIASLKSYLSTQYADGTPVQFLYQLATPVKISGTPIPIPTSNSISISNDNNANMSVEYTYQKLQHRKKPIQVPCDCYEYIEENRQILVDGLGYFIINQVEECNDNIDPYKAVTCNSCEIELNDKMLNLPDGTYQFWNAVTPTETIIGKILKLCPTWQVGSISSAVANTFIHFDSTSQHVYSFMMNDMMNAYQCVCVFDIMNRKINIISSDTEIPSTDILLTFDNVIKNIKIVRGSESIVTALNVQGDSEDVNIRYVNSTGSNVIYDFHYYMNTKWMSQFLIDALLAWEQKIANNKTAFDNYISQLTTAETELGTLDGQLSLLVKDLHDLQQADAINSTAQTHAAVVAQETVVSNKQAEIDAKNAQINTINANLTVLQTSLMLKNNLTQVQWNELSPFIKQDDYQDDNITITDSMDYPTKLSWYQKLYDKANKKLSELSQPTQTIDFECENFLLIKEFAQFRNQVELGNMIHAELSRNNVVDMMILKFSIDYGAKTLKITVSNRMKLHDKYSASQDLYNQVSESASSIALNKYLWSLPTKNGSITTINEYMKNSLDLSKQALILSSGQDPVFDSTGYHGRKKLDDGTYDPCQLWMTNNGIYLTDDNFTTIKSAFGKVNLANGTTAYGIIGDVIVGNMFIGNNMTLSGKIQSVDGKVYLDLDNSVGAFNKLISTEDGAEDTYMDIGMQPFLNNPNNLYKGLRLYTSHGAFVTMFQRDSLATQISHDSGTEISSAGDMVISSNVDPIWASPINGCNVLWLQKKDNGQGVIDFQRARLNSDTRTRFLYCDETSLYITQDFSTDGTNLGRVYFESDKTVLERKFTSSNYSCVTCKDGDIDLVTDGYTRVFVKNDAMYTGDIRAATIYSNGSIVTSDRDKKTNIESQDEVCALDLIDTMKFYKYTMLEKVPDSSVRMATINGYDNNIVPLDTAPLIDEPSKYQVEMGTMYDESPDLIKVHDGLGTKAIDLYPYISLTTKGLQEESKERKIEYSNLTSQLKNAINQVQDLTTRIEVLEKSK